MRKQLHQSQLLIQHTLISNKNAIAEVLQSEVTIVINDSEDKIADDEQDLRPLTVWML